MDITVGVLGSCPAAEGRKFGYGGSSLLQLTRLSFLFSVKLRMQSEKKFGRNVFIESDQGSLIINLLGKRTSLSDLFTSCGHARRVLVAGAH